MNVIHLEVMIISKNVKKHLKNVKDLKVVHIANDKIKMIQKEISLIMVLLLLLCKFTKTFWFIEMEYIKSQNEYLDFMEDMLQILQDGENKMYINIGLFKTHGVKVGELKQQLNLVQMVLQICLYKHYQLFIKQYNKLFIFFEVNNSNKSKFK
ncbi:unnamed protein product [Paramecium primaurelia]|uniref:Uncharacterized protein n=1 Tax=Paramecium primaurelia TaxID=5886 RepID=A0A8S1KRM2_PARPR|nr:unnamed protein product [Paramecium primaurelia]